jgi:hypothetical protein
MERKVTWLMAFGALAAGLSPVSPTFAQSAASGAATAVQSSPPPVADIGDSTPPSGWLLAAPIRLSLEGSVAPVGGRFAQCASLGDDVGNSVGGIPVQHYTEVRLMPKLVLSVFTQLGCPIDAGMGAALNYTAPVGRSTWLVFGAGGYIAPGQLPLGSQRGGPSPISTAARTDLVWKPTGGNPYHVGVQSLGRTHQQVVFGGAF